MAELNSALSFYLNLNLLNSSEVVQNAVKEKVGNRLIGKAAQRIAASRVDADAKISEKVVPELIKNISEKTKEMGLNTTIKNVFRHGSLVVLKLTINGANLVTLVRNGKGDKAGEAFAELIEAMDVLGVEGGVKNIEGNLLPKVKDGMKENLATTIPGILKEKAGIDVECFTKNPSEQADWFYDFLDTASTES